MLGWPVVELWSGDAGSCESPAVSRPPATSLGLATPLPLPLEPAETGTIASVPAPVPWSVSPPHCVQPTVKTMCPTPSQVNNCVTLNKFYVLHICHLSMANGSSFCTVSALVHKSINTNIIACEKISDGEKYFNRKFLSKFLPLSCTKWTLRPQVSYCNYFN